MQWWCDSVDKLLQQEPANQYVILWCTPRNSTHCHGKQQCIMHPHWPYLTISCCTFIATGTLFIVALAPRHYLHPFPSSQQWWSWPAMLLHAQHSTVACHVHGAASIIAVSQPEMGVSYTLTSGSPKRTWYPIAGFIWAATGQSFKKQSRANSVPPFVPSALLGASSLFQKQG